MLLSLILSSLISAARAEEPTINVTVVAPAVTDEAADATEIPTSQYGVSLVIGSNCSVKVTGKNLSAKKAGQLAGEIEAAKGKCMANKARRDDKARADQVATARSKSEDTLISAGADAVKNGGSVDYSSKANGDLHFVAGPAAEWSAYGTAVSNGNGYVPGMSVGYVDPQMAMLYRLGAGQAAFAAHPVVPGAVMPMQPAAQPATTTDNSAALGECQQALKAKGKLLESCENSGS